ncbi:DUF302 domain-containing protein [Chloroherpeton thalassium]|nr:DUF302 domain-containing protein [Chloroherpeton thalassium]
MKTLLQRTVALFWIATFALTGCDDDSSSSSKLLDPRDMVIEVESPYDTKTTVDTIVQNIIDLSGWGLAHGAAVSFSDLLNKGWTGTQYDSIYAIEICNPSYSGTILSDPTAKFASVMMPCVISVYQKDDGKTYVSYMNARLMGEVFQDYPIIRDMMGSNIAADQDKMLNFLDLPENDWGSSLPGLNKDEMVLDKQSLYDDIDTTVAKIREAIEADSVNTVNWEFFLKRETDELDETIKTKKPGEFDDLGRVCLIEICNKTYSRQILQAADDRFITTFLPCTIAVYEKEDGTVWIARMNTKRLGQVWGGTIEDVMSQLVTPDVAKFVVGK